MVVTDMFSKFARRMSSTQGFPYVVIAETPNPMSLPSLSRPSSIA